MKIKEFEAWIVSKGMPLPELCVEIKDRTIHCFIPCEVGKTFEVRWRDNGSKKFTAGYIYVDGYACPGRYLQGSGETFRAGARSGPVTERPFAFAPIGHQAPDYGVSGPNMKVGSIILKIMEAQRGPGRPSNPLEHLPVAMASNADAPKTGGVCLAFGDPEIPGFEQSPFTWSSKPVNPSWHHSYVKFEFKYRTRAWLQQQGMIPLDPPYHPYGMRPASEAMKLPMVPCAPPPPEMGATERAFVIPPDNLAAQVHPGPVVLPTTRIGDVASGRPARVPSNKYPRGLDGTVTMVRNVSGSSASASRRDDKGKGKATAPPAAATPRMPDAGDLATLAPPSSRPPIFTAPMGSNLFVLPPPRGGQPQQQQQRRVASSSNIVPAASLTPVTVVLPKPQGHSARSMPPRGFDFSLGPGIGAPSTAMHANMRRPLGSRNVSNSSMNSVDSVDSMGSMTSMPSVASGSHEDWMNDFVDLDRMDQS